MDYEKAYKEALERAREIHNEHRAQCFDVMVKVFPELKESVDERIRKELLKSFKYQQRELRPDKEWLNGIKLSEVVAWLEKQGEQKYDWSEEDEEVFHCLEYTVKHYYDDKDTISKCCSWLNSLKERIKEK